MDLTLMMTMNDEVEIAEYMNTDNECNPISFEPKIWVLVDSNDIILLQLDVS